MAGTRTSTDRREIIQAVSQTLSVCNRAARAAVVTTLGKRIRHRLWDLLTVAVAEFQAASNRIIMPNARPGPKVLRPPRDVNFGPRNNENVNGPTSELT